MPNPLYGLKLDKLLTDISDCYGWETLAEVLNIERFQFHTGLKSTMKFLRNHEWAKEKVENCYLYMYKNYPWPDDKQLLIPPRDRSSLGTPLSVLPAEINAQTSALIDHASSIRNSHKKDKLFTDEPAYDPTNPWNS
ncbi:DUF2132 domain-containing protein [Psychromonas sp. psych-6C06]|nr:DUF2132 domain-containing protein [Psychromonas sp. psych-6C06]